MVLQQLLVFLLTASAYCVELLHAEHWAVIVAGSRGYDNYRHQADACHAYHVARRHGIPHENVVLMMYDDVATADENPFKGQIFNKPSNASGSAPVDVYAGCQVDYRGEDVTPQNFLNVLLGNATATNGKKVLMSGADDRVFINFVDHGARGFVVFPHGEMLTSNQLVGTMQQMFAQKKYKELVFYVEACHSGSMFWSRSMSHINAYVTTAANGWESSWGTYCPPMDVVNGTALNTCLGDLYSVNWMEDSDRTDLSSESISQQFDLVKKQTSKSHVEQFGSKRIRREIVGNFQSNYDSNVQENDQAEPPTRDLVGARVSSAVATPDIPLVVAFYQYLRSSPGSERAQLAAKLSREIEERQKIDQLFSQIRKTYAATYGAELVAQIPSPSSDTNEQCESNAMVVFSRLVRQYKLRSAPDLPEGFSSYSLQFTGVITDLCAELGDRTRVEGVLQCAMANIC